MGHFDTFQSQALGGLAAMFGMSALYTPVTGDPVSCTVEISFNVELQPDGYESQVVETATVIEAIVSDVGSPAKGATFVIGSTTYTVRKKIADDGVTVQVVVI